MIRIVIVPPILPLSPFVYPPKDKCILHSQSNLSLSSVDPMMNHHCPSLSYCTNDAIMMSFRNLLPHIWPPSNATNASQSRDTLRRSPPSASIRTTYKPWLTMPKYLTLRRWEMMLFPSVFSSLLLVHHHRKSYHRHRNRRNCRLGHDNVRGVGDGNALRRTPISMWGGWSEMWYVDNDGLRVVDISDFMEGFLW